jgi:pimeloyl-ACP methyl ester carboxylesterase
LLCAPADEVVRSEPIRWKSSCWFCGVAARDGWSGLRQTALVSASETVYAKTSLGWVGYQVVGAGPPDVLVIKPPFLPVDLMWDEPRFVRFLNGLSSVGRHIWFDLRGTGSSDPIAAAEGRLTESIVDDMIAVLDELGCERVVVLGAIGPPALQFAATHPERTSALVLINPSARFRRADDYEGFADEEVDAILAAHRDRWGTGERLRRVAPSTVGDVRFARWFARCEHLAMSPQDAFWRFRATFEVDVRHLLGAIRVPTLVVVRAGWRGSEQGRYVAERIDGARSVELPGEDYLFFLGDTGPLLDAIEEFVTGRLPRHEVDRVLATGDVHRRGGLHRPGRSHGRPSMVGAARHPRQPHPRRTRTLPRPRDQGDRRRVPGDL